MYSTKFSKLTALILAALVGYAVAAAAKSPKLPFTWKNPDYSGGGFKRILVLAMNGRVEGRADFEDHMVAQIIRPGVKAVSSHSLLPRSQCTPIDMADLKAIVRDQKFDAVLVSRLVKLDYTLTYIPGQTYPLSPYYDTLYGFYTAVSPMVYSPDYLLQETVALVEANVYSTAKPDGELIWTGSSKRVNPRSETKTIDAVKPLVEGLAQDKII